MKTIGHCRPGGQEKAKDDDDVVELKGFVVVADKKEARQSGQHDESDGGAGIAEDLRMVAVARLCPEFVGEVLCEVAENGEHDIGCHRGYQRKAKDAKEVFAFLFAHRQADGALRDVFWCWGRGLI